MPRSATPATATAHPRRPRRDRARAHRAHRSPAQRCRPRRSGSSSSADRYEPQEIGEYLSALANAACLADQPRGYLVFGIDDVTHDVVGTRLRPLHSEGQG